MENNIEILETLLDRTADYGKSCFELVKLKVLDKTSDEISSFASHSIVVVIIATFALFLNLGVAFWIGELLGKLYLGFFVVAGFYAFIVLIMHFFLRKWFKRIMNDYFIQLYTKETNE
jgi:hypothetical protein